MENFRYLSEDELRFQMSSRRIAVAVASLSPIIPIFINYNTTGKIDLSPLSISIIVFVIGSLINHLTYRNYKRKEKSFLEQERIKANILKDTLR